MARSKETFGKKEREKKRLKKRKEKQQRKEERKAQAALNKENGVGFDDMIAYVDEFGNLTDTPPDPKNKIKIDAKKIRVSTPKMEEIEQEAMMEGKVEYFQSIQRIWFY